MRGQRRPLAAAPGLRVNLPGPVDKKHRADVCRARFVHLSSVHVVPCVQAPRAAVGRRVEGSVGRAPALRREMDGDAEGQRAVGDRWAMGGYVEGRWRAVTHGRGDTSTRLALAV